MAKYPRRPCGSTGCRQINGKIMFFLDTRIIPKIGYASIPNVDRDNIEGKYILAEGEKVGTKILVLFTQV